MRFLKNKIALAKSFSNRSLSPKEQQNEETSPKERVNQPKAPLKKSSYKLSSSTPKGSTSCKNIMKNYSRALVKFALSKVAIPYLEHLLGKEGENLQDFRQYLKVRRSKINCIRNLRELLLPEENDSKTLLVFKQVFQEISETFLKYFSVNWIFSSKVGDKLVHLKYRYKMLRRIRNPEYFTYLQSFHKD